MPVVPDIGCSWGDDPRFTAQPSGYSDPLSNAARGFDNGVAGQRGGDGGGGQRGFGIDNGAGQSGQRGYDGLTDGFDFAGGPSGNSENHPNDNQGGVSINDIYERVQNKRKRKRNEFFQRNEGCLDSFPPQRAFHSNDVRSLQPGNHPASSRNIGPYTQNNGHSLPSPRPEKPRSIRPNVSSRPFQGWAVPTSNGSSQIIGDDQSMDNRRPLISLPDDQSLSMDNGRQPLISLPDDQPIGLIMNNEQSQVDVESTEKTITFCDLSD